jgi:hypothetical protein
VFNNVFPGNTATEETSLMFALPVDDHYFCGGMKSLYLIGTVARYSEQALKSCLFSSVIVIFNGLKTSNLFAVPGNISVAYLIIV